MSNEAPKIVFAGSMEGLYRALNPLTPAERAAFLKAGIKGDGKFAPAYPLEQYLEVMDACAATRFGHLEVDQRYFEIGRLFIGGFHDTLMGSAMFGLLKVLGPRRAIDRLTRSFRSANNYVSATTTPLAKNHHLIHIDYTLQPGFYLGLLESSLTLVGAKELSVTIKEKRNKSTVYEAKWKE